MTDTVELDADFAQDPHSLYDRLRTEAPVYPVVLPDGVRAWLVTRYADAPALLNDPRSPRTPVARWRSSRRTAPGPSTLRCSKTCCNRIRPSTRGCAVPVDLVADYAAPLPVRVICEMLGMPAHYADRFRSAFHPLLNIATHAEKVAAERDTVAVLNDVIEYKRQVPGDDLLTSLIGASSDGDRYPIRN